jgi:hypothetical protein
MAKKQKNRVEVHQLDNDRTIEEFDWSQINSNNSSLNERIFILLTDYIKLNNKIIVIRKVHRNDADRIKKLIDKTIFFKYLYENRKIGTVELSIDSRIITSNKHSYSKHKISFPKYIPFDPKDDIIVSYMILLKADISRMTIPLDISRLHAKLDEMGICIDEQEDHYMPYGQYLQYGETANHTMDDIIEYAERTRYLYEYRNIQQYLVRDEYDARKIVMEDMEYPKIFPWRMSETLHKFLPNMPTDIINIICSYINEPRIKRTIIQGNYNYQYFSRRFYIPGHYHRPCSYDNYNDGLMCIYDSDDHKFHCVSDQNEYESGSEDDDSVYSSMSDKPLFLMS